MSDILFPFHSKFLTPDGDISRPWLLWLQNPQVLTISTQSPSTVANGGTGLSSTPISGQLLIGNGTGYSLNTLSASGITVTNGAGTIALSLNTFSPSSYGGVPASGGGTANFLRADGTWATPVGGGSAGPAGPIGPPGFDGNDGEDGQQGFPGPQGQPGTSGVMGAVGPMGMMGEDGADGDAGPPGLAGSAGQAGATGASGQIGPAGEDGSDAESFLIGIPTPQAAGSDTQVQYNSAGAFGANANFAYTVGTNTLTIGTLTSPAGNLILTPFAPATGTAPGALQITGSASQDSNNGGAVQIKSGTALTPSTGIGGLISLGGGPATSAAGGAFSMTGGSGTSGGGFTMLSGAGSSAASGGFTIGSGTGVGSGNFLFGTGNGTTGNSGNISFSTGASSATGGTTGTYTLSTGNQTGGGTSGSFNINIGTSATGTGGSIILRPGNGATKGSIRLRSSLVTDVIQITDNGTNQIGFFGATPVVKQTTGGTPTGAYTLNDVIAALQAYGLLV